MSINPRTRESPAKLSKSRNVSDDALEFKRPGEDTIRKAQVSKTAGRVTRQDRARQSRNRDSAYTPRSHKSIPTGRSGRAGSNDRTDSREQMYSFLHAWEGQGHE